MRKQSYPLKYIANISPQLFRIISANVFTIYQYLSAARLLKPVYHLERRRLAAAGFPDQAKQFSLIHTKTDIQYSKRSAAIVGFSDVAQFNHCMAILTSQFPAVLPRNCLQPV